MTEQPTLRAPHFVKIESLARGRSGYNVYVKVLKATPRETETRDGQKIPMVDAVVADETGSANAFFKGDNALLVKEGAVLAIRNGVKKIIKGHISLEIDIFGRVTPETVAIEVPADVKNISDELIKLEPRNNRRPQGGNRRNQNGGNRRRPEGSDNNRENRNTRENRDNNRPARQTREPRDNNRASRDDRRNDRRDDRRDYRRDDRRDNRNVRRDDRDYDRRQPRRDNDRDYDRRGPQENRNNDRPARRYQ